MSSLNHKSKKKVIFLQGDWIHDFSSKNRNGITITIEKYNAINALDHKVITLHSI